MKKRILALFMMVCLIVGSVGNGFVAYAEGEQFSRSFAMSKNDQDAGVDVPETEEPKQDRGTKAADGSELELREQKITADCPNGTVHDGDTIVLSGLLPEGAIAEAVPVDMEVEGQNVLMAYDIAVYADEEQKSKAIKWQPTKDEKLAVEISSPALEEVKTGVEVWSQEDETSDPELVKNASAKGSSVVYETDNLSVNAVVGTVLEKTVTTSDGTSYDVQVTYKNTSGIPMEGTELIVSELLPGDPRYDEYVAQSASKVGIDADSIGFTRVFDIRIADASDESHVYEPVGDVDVKITMNGSSLDDYSNVDVLHFVEDENSDVTVYDMETVVDGETVQFTTDSFSVYTIIAHEGGEVETPRVEFHFIAGTTALPEVTDGTAYYTAGPYAFGNKSQDPDGGKTQATMIVRNGDTLEPIEAPGDIGDAAFFGWYTVEMKSDSTTYSSTSHTFSGQIEYTWPDDTARIEFDNTVAITDVVKNGSGAVTSLTWTIGDVTQTVTGDSIDAEGCAHVYIAPIYTNYHFVNFHLAPRGDSAAPYIMTRKLIVLGNSNHTDIRVGDVNSGYQDPTFYRFVGWEYYDEDSSSWVHIQTVDEDDNELDNLDGKTGTYLTATGKDYDLYPVFVEVRWITFNRGAAHNGSDYLAPKHIRTSDSSTTDYPVSRFYGADVAKRVGYEFDGWFLNADMGNGSEILNPDTAIRLTDANGEFVLLGQVFYRTAGDDTVRQCATDDLPADAIKLYEIDSEGQFYVYSGLNSRLPVYAKWDAQTSASYKVVFWMQRVTDEADAVNHDWWVSVYRTSYPDATDEEVEAAWESTGFTAKTYDFYSFDGSRTAAGNTKVSPTGDDLDKLNSTAMVEISEGEEVQEKTLFVGFTLGYYDSQVTVDPQGTTVLNVYYDRIIHTLTFQDEYVISVNDNDNNPEKYGDINGAKARVYWRNGAFRTTDRNNGTIYNGTVYYHTNWYTVKTITAVYGHNISDQFAIVGTNGITYDSGERWAPQNSTTFQQVLVYVDAMPNEDIIFRVDTSTNSMKTLYYYVEVLPSEEPDSVVDGIGYKLYQTINAKYGFFTESEDFMEINGFEKHHSSPEFDQNGEARNVTELRLYYTRRQYSITFLANYPGEVDTSDLTQTDNEIAYAAGRNGSEKATFYVANIYYEQKISDIGDVAAILALQGEDVEEANKYPLIPSEHKFDGWFTDASATVQFDFDSYMPDGNVIVYAGWSMIRYRILIDPNGGVMDHINYPRYGSMLTETGLDINSTYNDAFATYFNNTAAETIHTDQDIENLYVQIDSAEEARILAEGGQVYRYVNMQYDKAENLNGGIYASYAADARNAVYILDTPESIAQYYNYYCTVIADSHDGTAIPTQQAWEAVFLSSVKYRHLNPGESYAFVGWFELNEETGELSTNAFDFSRPTDHRTHLVAQWRLDSGYTLQYSPDYVFVDEDNTTYEITGSIEEFYDPDPTLVDHKYADGATTMAMEEPSAIKINGVADSEGLFQFRGWQIVRVETYGGETHYSVPDEEEGVYYTAGQSITIHGRYAQEEMLEDGVTKIMVIHLRAVYEMRSDAYRRPEVVNLTIDAAFDGTQDDGGTSAPVGQGYLNTTDSSSLPLWTYPGHQYIDDATKTVDGTAQPYRILFGDAQANTAIHLYKYATLLSSDEVNGGAAGQNFFVHSNGYQLIGFDLDAPDNDFLPTYAADAVIAVSPGDSHTLYAVWEPMVYITFVNDTGVGDVVIRLSSDSERAMYVVNQTDGRFSRVAVDTTGGITVPEGESVKLVMPYGSGEDIVITGTNELGVGYMLTAKSERGITNPEARTLTGSITGSAVDYTEVKNGENFGFFETLVTDAEGIVITFTATQAPHTLILDDNYDGGGSREINFKENTNNVVYYETENVTTYTLPGTSTRIGYELIGWDENKNLNPDTQAPAFSVDAGWTIDNLTTFFNGEETKTLYAIWKANAESSTVYVWKDVQGPAAENDQYTFTVAFSGVYSYRRNIGNNFWANWQTYSNQQIAEQRATLTLLKGEYLELYSTKKQYNGNEGTGVPYLSVMITRYKLVDGVKTQVGTPQELRWQWAQTNDHTWYNDFTFTNINISVTENDVNGNASDLTTKYDTEVEKASETTTYSLTVDSDARKASWEDTEPGGTIIFHNTRKTADVTIRKTLLPATLQAETFPFTVKFIDGTGAETNSYEGYTLNPTTQAVLSGTGEWKIEGIPTGAKLQITETVDSNKYTTSVAAVSTAAVADLDTANDNIFRFVVAEDTTVTFTNELKQKKIRLVLADDDDPANLLSGGTFTLPGIFVDTNMAAEGLIWQGDAYVGTYTLTQYTAPDHTYRKLQSPVTLVINGDGVTATTGNAADTVLVEYVQADDEYIIRIVNPKLMLVTVKKVIDAPAEYFKTGTFGFTATLTDVSDPANPVPVQVSDVIGTRGTDANGRITFTLVNNQSVTLYVPRNVNLQLAESADAAFITEVQTGATEAEALSADKDETNTTTFGSVTTDKYVLFTNTLKTVDVMVKKEVVGTLTGSDGTFGFTAFLRYNGVAVKGYLLAEGIVTGDGTDGSTEGVATFTLTPETNGIDSITFTIPSGSVLVLTENELVGVSYSPSYRVEKEDQTPVNSGSGASVTLTATQTVEYLKVTFTNAAMPVAPTGHKTHTMPYVLMLVFGGLFLWLIGPARKRRKRCKAD